MDKLKIWGRRLLDAWGIYQLLTVVGFTAITSTLTLAFVRELRSLPLGWQTTFVAGVALFGLVGVWIFWPLVTRLRAKLAGQSELEQSAIATPAVPSVNYPPPEEELPGGENIQGVSDFQFFSTRPSFEWFRGQIENSSEVWAIWQTGVSAANYGIFRTGRFKRLLLASPQNPVLPLQAEIAKSDVGIAQEQIRSTTKEAQRYSVTVLWWLGYITDAITLADPTSEGAWALIESIVPLVDADQRFAIWFTRKGNEAMYDRFRESFLEMWGDSARTFDPT